MNVKLIFFVVVLFWSHPTDAQFNTLVRIPFKNEAATLPVLNTEKVQDMNNVPGKRVSRSVKLFGFGSKAELKKENDSLKSELRKTNRSTINQQKLNFKRIDSLILILKANAVHLKRSRYLRTFDSIEGNEPKLMSKIHMPLKNRISVTSAFGTRKHPIFGIQKMHNGADLKASYENVHAVLDGVVTASGWDLKGGGNYISIKHANAYVTSYLHLSEIYYRVGEYVKAGFIIAKSGNSGNSTGAHLHFSVSKNGDYINPINFLNGLIKANNLIATHYANQ